MAARPVVIVGTAFPRDKSGDPYPITIAGWAYDPSARPAHPIVLPPEQVPPIEPPLVIWPNPPEGTAPLPEHPIVLPDPPEPPNNPPSTTENVHPGWNFNDGKNPQYPNVGWYFVYVPKEGEAEPKKK